MFNKFEKLTPVYVAADQMIYNSVAPRLEMQTGAIESF